MPLRGTTKESKDKKRRLPKGKSVDGKPHRVRSVRASRKALAFRRDTDKVRQVGVSCRQQNHGINQDDTER